MANVITSQPQSNKKDTENCKKVNGCTPLQEEINLNDKPIEDDDNNSTDCCCATPCCVKYDYLNLCRCFAWYCKNIAECTEGCFDCCAECLSRNCQDADTANGRYGDKYDFDNNRDSNDTTPVMFGNMMLADYPYNDVGTVGESDFGKWDGGDVGDGDCGGGGSADCGGGSSADCGGGGSADCGGGGSADCGDGGNGDCGGGGGGGDD